MTGKVLTYDGNGNLSYDGTFTYVHDALNRLASATKQGSTNTYQYGPMGRRTLKDEAGSTTSYLYSGDHAAVEYDDSGALVRKFIYGLGIDEPLLMITPSQDPTAEIRHYYHADVLGSVVGLANSTGAWAETYSYSAWGELNGSSSVGNPYFYTGRRYDAETGLYYYWARYYDAYLRRFIQPDPIGFDGGMNWYAYVRNSPLNYVDPWGLEDPYKNHTEECKAWCEARQEDFLTCKPIPLSDRSLCYCKKRGSWKTPEEWAEHDHKLIKDRVSVEQRGYESGRHDRYSKAVSDELRRLADAADKRGDLPEYSKRLREIANTYAKRAREGHRGGGWRK